MSFWSTLGKIGKVAGYVAAPFTGGLSLLAEPAIGAAEGAAHGGLSGALKGGLIGGAEAAIPFGIGKIAGPALGGILGQTGGKIGAGVLGNVANGEVNKLAAKAGTSPVNMPSNISTGNGPITGFGTGSNDLFGGGGYGAGGQLGYDESGNPTTDPSQVYQDNNGNIVSSSPDTGYVGYDVYGNPTNDPKSVYQNMNGDITGSDGSSSGGGTGVIDKILKGIKGAGAGNLTDLGKTLGSFSNAEANNRATTGDFMQNYDRLALADQTGRNQNESDALKKLAITSYLGNGGSKFKLPSYQLNGQTRTPVDFGLGPQPASAAQMQGANTLQGQLLKRLQPGGSVSPTDPTTYTKPGTAENIGKYGALISSGLGAITGMFGPQAKYPPSQQPTYPGNPNYPGTPPIV